MSYKTTPTGMPSIDKPWLKYYPPILMDHLQVPECTLTQYLQHNMPGLDVPAMHYYGTEITWRQVFTNTNRVAKALKAVGFGLGDQIPVFLRSVPEFIYMLLAAEKIGASVLIRDNEVWENAEAVKNGRAKVMFVHDFLSQADLEEYLASTEVEKVVVLDPCNSCDRSEMPDYIRKSLDSNYPAERAHGKAVMTWNQFLALGDRYTGGIDVRTDIHRPLFRCYTSGSTGPSKQVIHSAYSMIGVLAQMNFYGGADFRPTWMVTILPPALVAVVISMLVLPLASNKLLILNPWVDVYDLDLEIMRYKPNNWPMIPMFIEVLMNSDRIPADYDMSHLVAAGAGCEALNNTQLKRAQKFLDDHNCHVKFTTGYGSSEAGSNVTFHISDHPVGNGNVGCPMPLTTVGIFKPGTTKELGFNVEGEICVSGPGVMLGYDDPVATDKALMIHDDGRMWLHMGDIGYINEDGVVFAVGRGSNKRYGGGFLDLLPMENRIADANIEGLVDEFFVNVPDQEHPGYSVPYLCVVLEDGITVDSIRAQVNAALKPHMIPEEIIVLPERPFWHFKTNRIGMTKEILKTKSSCVA